MFLVRAESHPLEAQVLCLSSAGLSISVLLVLVGVLSQMGWVILMTILFSETRWMLVAARPFVLTFSDLAGSILEP